LGTPSFAACRASLVEEDVAARTPAGEFVRAILGRSAHGRGQRPERIDDAAQRAEIVESLSRVFTDVRACVTDWRPMLARIGAVSEESARGMLEWHGKRAADIARMALVRAELRAPICPHTSHVIAEVVEAYRRECAVTLADALLRRVPVALGACWSESCSRAAALRIGAVLGWDEHTMGANLEAFEMERTAFLRPVQHLAALEATAK